ncbi:SgcJ/EcaC family oxidoreductase [Nocardia cyriacigeorgica]|jgi:steroid Delta-isomerase|uniref:SgcJ/EcaC family oxidoreductase n=1 Tax=Nocardia cyriacigeorgica TaxID=135487 RepID=UPI0002DCB9A4|nr:SgcJ/EcaC family oxidoreductase [Nocardia cyriacigeorgica]AVH23999.1 steroid delta-isomerase [Nocardia cyriacigeorgica]MBF6416220.1 SgcJ/EcaC family oxidoreductase [Nocardia cyriacigeorgica]MBF6499621.1 SgcJ/EcaC family oxidoreductase [Nocardia cyriacigeorgica]PPJ09045.1 steroid delta-isomerase [Nocardia cyriacigeorgica]TLF54054.1 SgcJ/EcaC family oxidoreductase [Nocardia cyriacigeorgica]
MASADDIRAAVRRYLDTVANGSAKDIAALYTDDATVEDPVGSPPHIGRAAIEKFYSALESVRVSTELHSVRVAGDQAAFGFRVVTDTGEQTIVIEPIDVMTFDEDARITSMRAFWSPDDISLG